MRLQDRFQWFLAPALLLFLLSYWLELPLTPLARALSPRGRRPHRASAPAIAAALVVLFAWPLFRQAQAVAADAPPPRSVAAASQPPDLAGTVAELSARPALAAPDYERLAADTIAFAAQPSAPRGPARDGIIDDALAAVDRGERQDARAADWPDLRRQLEALRQPPEQPQGEQQEEQRQQGRQDQAESQQNQQQAGGEQPQGEHADDQQARGNGQAGSPQQEAKKDTADEPRAGQEPSAGEVARQPDAEPLDAAGLGDEQAPAAPPTRLVGGGQVTASAPASDDPATADALARMAQVKNGDAPAVLFDRMNRAEGLPRSIDNGKNW